MNAKTGTEGLAGRVTLAGVARGLALALVSAALCAGAPVRAEPANEPAIPAAGKRLIDQTQSLNPSEQTQVIGKLKEIEEKTRAQVAVLIVQTTEPQSIEEYAVRVVEAWKIGQAKVDNGLLIVIAKKDGKVRMEVGRGLEGAIPDLHAKRIIDQAMLPSFRQGKYAAGLIAGLDQVLARIQVEVKAPPASVGGKKVDQVAQDSGMGSGLKSLLVFLLVLGIVIWLSKMFGLNKGAAPVMDTDRDNFTSSSSSGSSGSGTSDDNSLAGGGGESAGGGATSSYSDSSSSGSPDSGGSSDSGGGGSDSGGSDSSKS